MKYTWVTIKYGNEISPKVLGVYERLSDADDDHLPDGYDKYNNIHATDRLMIFELKDGTKIKITNPPLVELSESLDDIDDDFPNEPSDIY